MVNAPSGEVQRWTAKGRVALVVLVVSIRKGETPVQQVAAGLTVAENGLRACPKDKGVLKQEPIKKLKQKLGEVVRDLDILEEVAENRRPFPRAPSES